MKHVYFRCLGAAVEEAATSNSLVSLMELREDYFRA